jgi:hypothetical protein
MKPKSSIGFLEIECFNVLFFCEGCAVVKLLLGYTYIYSFSMMSV